MEQILQYFNLSVAPGAGIHTIVAEPIPWQWQLALYGALIVGILANGYLAAVRSKRRYRFSWQRFLVSVIVGIVIFPAIYQGAQANLGQPSTVQLALIFASGLGYESLFSGIVSLAAGAERR
ncbi:MAG: hypothetical protein JXA37_12175 [Chloroflexia bacterium]|nr:hypothetical protein [Chloroflexia bacterium]